MKQFFPMGKGEIPVLAFLIAFAVISFLPIWRTIEIGGMAVFGWLMAALMVVSPVLTLLVLRRVDKTTVCQSPEDLTNISAVSDSTQIEQTQKRKPDVT